MLIKTKIPWCDCSWGVVTGCSHGGSPGCDNCYARKMALRFHKPWGFPVLHPEKLEDPTRRQKPARIFVASTSDLFHEDCGPWGEQQRLYALLNIWDVMARNQHHTFIILTKRPKIMRGFVNQCELLPNVWLGVSVSTQAEADEKLPILLSIPAAVHLVSGEPMLESISLAYSCFNGADTYGTIPDLEWVIAGPETGSGKRPCSPKWILDLELECSRAGVPFFDKRENWGMRMWPGWKGSMRVQK